MIWGAAPPDLVAALSENLKEAVSYYNGCESLTPYYPGENVHPDPILQPGKIGKAFLIERRTVNMIANPDFDSDGNSWLLIGQPEILSNGGFASPKSCAVTNADYIRQVIPGLKEKTLYCLSIYARSPDGGGLDLSMNSGSLERLQTEPLPNEYTRIKLPFIAHAEVGTATIKSTTGKRVIVDGVQLESGKSWPASFFAAAGTQRSGEWVDIPATPQTYNPSRGTVAFWLKPQWIGEVDSGMAFFSAFENPNRGWHDQKSVFLIQAYVNPKEKDWHNSIIISMKDKFGREMEYRIPLGEKFRANEWFHCAVTWDIIPGRESVSTLYINAQKNAEKHFLSDGMQQPACVFMGYAAGAYADALMDEFYIFSRPLTEEEVCELYQTAVPFK
jgi:hypothetical protein